MVTNPVIVSPDVIQYSSGQQSADAKAKARLSADEMDAVRAMAHSGDVKRIVSFIRHKILGDEGFVVGVISKVSRNEVTILHDWDDLPLGSPVDVYSADLKTYRGTTTVAAIDFGNPGMQDEDSKNDVLRLNAIPKGTVAGDKLVESGSLGVVGFAAHTGEITMTPAASSNPGAPIISTHPVSRTIKAGQTAAFTQDNVGLAPVTVQWQKNGVDIPGATSLSYTTPAQAISDSGTKYRAVVTNASGSVTTDEAVLTVVP